jgi:hypothetical protein
MFYDAGSRRGAILAGCLLRPERQRGHIHDGAQLLQGVAGLVDKCGTDVPG